MTQTSVVENPNLPIHADVSAPPAKAVKAKQEAPAASKTDLVLKKLRGSKGVSIAQLAETTGWQLHSVRGFLSGIVKKKLGLNLISETGKDGVRRYRVVNQRVGSAT